MKILFEQGFGPHVAFPVQLPPYLFNDKPSNPIQLSVVKAAAAKRVEQSAYDLASHKGIGNNIQHHANRIGRIEGGDFATTSNRLANEQFVAILSQPDAPQLRIDGLRVLSGMRAGSFSGSKPCHSIWDKTSVS